METYSVDVNKFESKVETNLSFKHGEIAWSERGVCYRRDNVFEAQSHSIEPGIVSGALCGMAADILTESTGSPYAGIALAIIGGKVKSSNAIKANSKNLHKGFKEVKQFGLSYGQKVYKKVNKYYSRDVAIKGTKKVHNGGEWKVYKKSGNNIIRVGTADKDLNIFKK